MKKIFLLLFAAACSFASWAQSTVSATVKGQKLEVALTNDNQDFVAFQMDIVLPTGVNVPESDAVTLNSQRLTQPGTTVSIAGGNETANFQVAYNVLTDGKLRVIAYNLENRALEGKAGELFSVAFTGTATGDFTVENIKFVTKEALAEIEFGTIQSNPGASYVPGDVTGDGEVDLFDVLAVIDLSLGKSNPAYNLEAADTNGDGEYDLFDVLAIINSSLGK